METKTIYVCTRNNFIDKGDYIEIELGKKNGKNIYGKIDKKSIYKIKDHKWCVDSGGYAITNTGEKNIRLHTFLLGQRKGYVIDHENGNKLDNRIKNLRFCTQSENQWNRKNSVGVSYDKTRKKFRAYITVNKEVKDLGRFINFKDALSARLCAEKNYYGKYRYKNRIIK